MDRDAYEAYGYTFRFFDGSPLDESALDDLIDHFNVIDDWTKRIWEAGMPKFATIQSPEGEVYKIEEGDTSTWEALADGYVASLKSSRIEITRELINANLTFYNPFGHILTLADLVSGDDMIIE